MPATEEPRKTSTISSQIFALLKVGITLALTGLIGGGITYYYRERAHLAQQEQADLATARQSALTFLREVGDILEQRRHFALRVLDTIQGNAPPEERDQAWKDYMNAVNAWNVKWNLYRALVLEQFGPEMQKRFYDEKADSEATWANYSITGKLMSFHNALEELHNATPDKPPPRCEGDAKALFVYFAGHLRLLFGVISRIEEGRIGKHSWTPGNTPKRL
jgi:hypothetical protein